MRTFVLRLVLVLAATFGLAFGPAFAQSYYGYTWGNGITDNDFRMLEDATNALLSRQPLAAGTSESWHDNQTGAHGTARITGTFRYHGLLCHKIGYVISPAGSFTRNLHLSWCKAGESDWRIL